MKKTYKFGIKQLPATMLPLWMSAVSSFSAMATEEIDKQHPSTQTERFLDPIIEIQKPALDPVIEIESPGLKRPTFEFDEKFVIITYPTGRTPYSESADQVPFEGVPSGSHTAGPIAEAIKMKLSFTLNYKDGLSFLWEFATMQLRSGDAPAGTADPFNFNGFGEAEED